MTTDDKCQSCGFPRWSPPGVTCVTHEKHSIQATDDARVAVKDEGPVSGKDDQSTWTPWQRYCYRVHQHRLETIPGYKEDLERRSAEFVERVGREPPLNPCHSEDTAE